MSTARWGLGGLLLALAGGVSAQAYGPPISLEQARKVYAAADAEARKTTGQ